MCVSVCIALTQLSLDDENAFQIRKNKGVYIVGQLFLSGSQAPASDPTARELQVYALRMLRFIYSVERNRKVFKRLFPPLFYSSFIDVGHYDHNLAPYTALAEDFNRLPWAQKASAIAAFESLRSVSEGKRTLRGYIIQEVLGKGAFGTVYQVQKENSDSLYAMKELPLKEGQVPDHDMQRYVSALCEEVEIISKLEHPNIVKYYTSFVEGGHMYIIMELVQGTSLTDYISSVRGKQQRMSEEQIWSIFIQLTLALSYMHMERGVVHRDLTPSNVMVDQNGKVKITDFGLARQKNKESLMKSAVGTISFSCPEIILHKPYTEKADLWSLGCVLYQMAMLRPAFQGNNPLTVAQKIVEGQHEPLSSDLYSPLLTKVVTQLLAVKPEQRPNIIQVSALVSPLLMAELDRVNIINNRLTTQLKHEQELRRRDLDDFSRKQQAWRHILGSYGVSRAFMIDSAGAGGHTAPAHGSSSSSLLGDADKSTDATGMKAGMEQGKGGHINPNPAHSRPLRLPLQDMKDNRDRPLNVNTQIPSSAATPRASSSFSSLSSLPSSVGSYKGSNRHTRSRRGNTGRSTDKNKPGHSNAHSGSNSNNDVQSVHSNGDSPRSGSTATSALRSSSKSKRKSTASAGGAMAGDGLMSGGLGVVGVGLSNVSSSGGSKDTSPRNHQYQRQHSSNKAHASHDTTIQSTQGSSNSNDMDDSKHPSSASSSAASSSQSTQQQQQQQLQSVQVNNFPRYYSRQRQQFHSHTHSHRHHPGASKPIVHILSDKLRIIQDPIAAILTQLHKIVYLSQQPPTLEKDARRSYLIKYKRALFASSPTQSALKVEMQRLLSGSKDLVDLTFGVSGGEGGVNGGRGASRHSSNPTHALSLLTHEDLQVMIEKLLDETDYYCSSVQSSLSSSSLSSSSSSSSSAAIVTSSSALRTSTASVVGIYDPSSLLTLADPTSSSSSNSSTDIKHFDTNDKHVLHSNSIAYLDAERKHGREEGERDDKNNGDGKGSDFGSLSQVKDPFLIRNLFESPTNSGDNLNFPSFPKRSSSSDSSNNHVNTLDIDSSGENFDEVMSNVLPNVYRHGSMSSNTSSASMTAHLSSGKLRNKHANRSAHVNRGESVNLECLVQQGLSDEEIVNNFLQIGRVDSSTQQSDSKTSCADVGVEGDSLGIGDDSLDSDSAIFDNRHYIPSSSPTSPVQTPNKYSSKRKCDIDNDGKTCPPRNHSGNDGRIQLTPAHISSRLRLLNIDNEREFSSPARALNNIFQREKGDSDDSYADIGTSIDSSCGANRLGSNISSNPNSGTKSDGLIFQAI